MMRVKGIPLNRQKAFYAELSPVWQLVYDVTMATGWRITDVLSLRTDNIGKNTLHCIAEKTGKPDIKRVPPRLISRIRQNAGQFWAFPSPHKGDLWPLTRAGAHYAMTKAAKAVGIKNISSHSLRKTAAQKLYRRGKKVSEVQTFLQHDKRETTLLYLFDDD